MMARLRSSRPRSAIRAAVPRLFSRTPTSKPPGSTNAPDGAMMRLQVIALPQRSSAPLRIRTRPRAARSTESRSRSPVQQKRGRPTPPFLAGEAAYRFLPPFFFPPLAVFFAIALYPSLRSWDLRGLSPQCSAAASWHVSLCCRRPSLRWINSRRSLREVRIRKTCNQKN